MKFTKACIIPGILGLLLCLTGCNQDPEIENNEPDDPRVELEVVSRISAELSITSSASSSDITYGAEIIRIVNGEESNEVISFQTRELDEEHRYSWWTEGLQPNNTYVARSFITNGRNRKYSETKTFTTPSTSKPSVSIVTMEGGHLVAKVLDNGGRSIVDVGFVAGDTPDRKSLLRKEKIPALEYIGEHFSLPLNSLESGKTYYVLSYAIDNQEDVGYGSTPIEVNIPQGVESVSLDKAELYLEPGETFTLTATVKPDNALDKTVVWASSNISIATVTDGLVEAMSEGTASITASVVGGQSASCAIFVTRKSTDIPITPERFPDDIFRDYVNSNFDTNGDAYLSQDELNSVNAIRITGVTSLVGIECFEELIHLECSNNSLASLDLSNNQKLKHLDCANCSLSTLDLSHQHDLKYVNCKENQLDFLDLSYCPSIVDISCSYNKLSAIVLSGCHNIRSISCNHNRLTSLDISECPSLISLFCPNNQISQLELSNNMSLQDLRCDYNRLEKIDVSNSPKLEIIECRHNLIEELTLPKESILRRLDCTSNLIKELDLSNCTSLESLQCNSNMLTRLSLSGCTALSSLSCYSNELESIDISSSTYLSHLNVNDNHLADLNTSNCFQLTSLSCNFNNLNRVDVSHNQSLSLLFIDYNPISEIDLSSNQELYQFSCSRTLLQILDVSHNPNLKILYCSSNQYLKDIYLSMGQVIEDFHYDEGVSLHFE